MFGIYRFVLALNVVVFHILAVPNVGPLAVYSFFVLSGFLMTLIMHQTYGYTTAGFKKYALNRFYRLYPIYWLLVILALVVVLVVGAEFSERFHSAMRFPNTFSSVLANASMIYPLWKPSAYPVRISPASWALTIEIIFYLLIGLGLSRKKMITWVWFALSMSYFLYNNLILQLYSFGYGNFITASLPFSAGALVFFYKDRVNVVLGKLRIGLLPLLVVFAFNTLVAASTGLVGEEGWKISFLCTGLNLLLSVLLTGQLAETKAKSAWLKKWDRELGDLSYPIYLFHWTAAALAAWLLYGSPDRTILVFAVGLLITLVVSYVINFSVNRKIEQLRTRVKNSS